MYLKTLIDVGLIRVLGRINYELRKIIDRSLPKSFTLYFLCQTGSIYPSLNKDFELLVISKFDKPNTIEFDEFSFDFEFLNEKYTMNYPFDWNDISRSRLWIFNLHYFDWARYLIEKRIKNEDWSRRSYYLEKILDNWIDSNIPGHGYGWHSYTISLRIRNWIWIFRFFPSFLSKKRINSLWEQICWLNEHIEDHLGGNHLLENLISLIIGSTQFENRKSRKILEKGLFKLEIELNKQILNDGGHEERSASYHILLMDRLTETGFVLEKTKYRRPDWLINNLKKMLIWSEKISLLNGYFPNFNDSPLDGCEQIETVKSFVKSYLFQTPLTCNSFKANISKLTSLNKSNQKIFKPYKNIALTDLKDTGWTIVRPHKGFEIIFKCGDPCPKHLPGHVHSDQLSFDIYKDGEALIAETGTSVYEKSSLREYERSSRAHNIFQLGIPRGGGGNYFFENTHWIDSVECWDSFRAARKSKVLYRNCKQESNHVFSIKGSNDSYKYSQANHLREINLTNIKDEFLFINVIDYAKCKRKMNWRSFWHIGPNQNEFLMKEMISKLSEKHKFNYYWEDKWISVGFGKRIYRKTLCLNGQIYPGEHIFSHVIKIKI